MTFVLQHMEYTCKLSLWCQKPAVRTSYQDISELWWVYGHWLFLAAIHLKLVFLFLCRVTISLVVKVWDTDVSAGHPPAVLTVDMFESRLVVRRKVGTN